MYEKYIILVLTTLWQWLYLFLLNKIPKSKSDKKLEELYATLREKPIKSLSEQLKMIKTKDNLKRKKWRELFLENKNWKFKILFVVGVLMMSSFGYAALKYNCFWTFFIVSMISPYFLNKIVRKKQ